MYFLIQNFDIRIILYQLIHLISRSSKTDVPCISTDILRNSCLQISISHTSNKWNNLKALKQTVFR